jgi:excisionase family DNA binding protein
LKVPAAAVYLGVTEKALRKRVERGNIPYIKDGRSVKFDTHALDQFMAQRAVFNDQHAA